ncbi:hypothetical protein SAMN05660860_01417 [Geoalkalibacter ferrihydriticus]|uniref:Lipoprotein n=3 Tax=Geoalkalibacter ferrihydriticus TaxID=392333 RepID=A0A0C2EDQ6_9BACT|nr:hypothetical protein GFER_09020 [Geoalkalibacter ferrihydriticus DSM 17813]SDL91354.1 hypothetical protein SAMN05660860_01417 [Geoalkalibacter ferrihydriticus]
MKRWIVLAFFVLFLTACSDRAGEMYETAQFEELQRNIPRALTIYQDIVDQHPDSPHAEKARERIAALEGEAP